MTADDSRAVPDTERAVRSWLTDIVEDEPEGAYKGRTAEEIRDATRTLALLDRLRAELAETRAKVASHEADLDLTINRLHNFGQAGDALADELSTGMQRDWAPDYVTWVSGLINVWRSVRGDAPAVSDRAGDDEPRLPSAVEIVDEYERAQAGGGTDTQARLVIHDAGVTRYHADGSREVLFEVPAAPATATGGRDLTAACDFSGGPLNDRTLAVPRSELPVVVVTDEGDFRSSYVLIERNGELVYRYVGEASAGEWESCPRVPTVTAGDVPTDNEDGRS